METNQTLKRQTRLSEFMTPLEKGVVRSGNLASMVVSVLEQRRPRTITHQHSAFDLSASQSSELSEHGDKMEANLMGSRRSSISEWKLIEKQCTFFSDHPEIACKIIEVPFG